MLPDSKSDFPKCLYLDQNKWIDLAKAHYGKPGGEQFLDALLAVRSAVRAGTLVVPFSAVNAVEAQKNGDPERRRRLARFMVDLANNFAILPYTTICPWELTNALRLLFSNLPTIRIRPSIIRQGYGAALGKEP